MNPDDKQPTTPGVVGSTPPEEPEQPLQSPTVGGASSGGSKGSKKWLMWLLILLLILAALGFGWWWMNKDDDTATNTTETTESTEAETACAEGTTAYESTELGFGFCYPTDWGTVAVTDAKFATADSGERWKVSFADKAAVNLGVVTADWATEVARDGTCVDPAVQTLPAFSPFSTEWVTDGTPVTSATRGIEVQTDQFLINEEVDDLLGNGVCIHGYTLVDADPYTHTSASYSAEFAGAVMTPQAHVDDPNVLVTEASREEFYDFVKSVHAL